MIGVTLPQPIASAVVYGAELGAGWPTEWKLRPDAVGQYIAIHAGVAWTPEHAARAAQLGVDDCPRGRIVGLARVSGWSRLAAEGPTWLGDPGGPGWARQGDIFDRRALVDRWPLCVESAAVFFDDAVPLTAAALGVDDAELVCLGDASGPWAVPARLVRALRARWGAPEPAPAPSGTIGRPSGAGPAARCSQSPQSGAFPSSHGDAGDAVTRHSITRPPTEDARANLAALAGLLPDGWSARADDFTVSIVDPTGRCRRSLVRLTPPAELAHIVGRVVHR